MFQLHLLYRLPENHAHFSVFFFSQVSQGVDLRAWGVWCKCEWCFCFRCFFKQVQCVAWHLQVSTSLVLSVTVMQKQPPPFETKRCVVTWKWKLQRNCASGDHWCRCWESHFREIYHNHFFSSFCGLIFLFGWSLKLSWETIKQACPCFVCSFCNNSAY